MALFILFLLIISSCLYTLLGSEESSNKVLEIKSTTITADQNIGFYKVDETLNLTCVFKNESILPDVVLEWIVPGKASNSRNRVIYRRGTNVVILIIESLQENDSGEYKCRAVHNGTPFFNSESSVRIKVKNRKKECTDVMFRCSAGICIPKRYTCDGFRDCLHGEDESPIYCGPGNPCDNKLMCPNYRCIPFTWCCEFHREPNCTTKVKHSCCTHVEKLTRDVDSELDFQFEQQRFSDMGFLQTTVYTVIGCAMAFMFIITIIVIAICRVHVRRTLLSRCPSALTRNSVLGRGANVLSNNLTGWSAYDLDFYFNRSGLRRNDLMSVNPLLVTYNINNGVQFVGRPIDPPPYCEIVTSPPKEGPPPPYASQENLCVRREDKTEEPNMEARALFGESEAVESDALLSASAQSISIISCSSIDVVFPSEESVVAGNFSSFEGGNKYSECGSKECSKAEFSNESSHCFSDENKQDGQRNCCVNILVLESGSSETSGIVKVQTGKNPGECSTCDTGNNDISKGAVKKIYATKSLDSNSNFRRKNKTFSLNPNKAKTALQ